MLFRKNKRIYGKPKSGWRKAWRPPPDVRCFRLCRSVRKCRPRRAARCGSARSSPCFPRRQSSFGTPGVGSDTERARKKRPNQGNGSKKTAEGTCSFLIFCGNVRHEPDVFHKSAINTAKLSMITFIDGFGGIKSNCNAEEEYCKMDFNKTDNYINMGFIQRIGGIFIQYFDCTLKTGMVYCN